MADNDTQDIDRTATYGRAFMDFAVKRGLDIDDPDWPKKDQDDWDAIAATLEYDTEDE